MGWNNPDIPWRELERRLSGRPQAPWQELVGDGGDLPAWSRKRPGYGPARLPRPAAPGRYGELHAYSSFSFLDGASSPEELAEEAVRLGLESLTLTDHDPVYGVGPVAGAAPGSPSPPRRSGSRPASVPNSRSTCPCRRPRSNGRSRDVPASPIPGAP